MVHTSTTKSTERPLSSTTLTDFLPSGITTSCCTGAAYMPERRSPWGEVTMGRGHHGGRSPWREVTMGITEAASNNYDSIPAG